MRWRGANFLRSTCAARTASSSSSSKANSGTCFSSTGSQGMGHLVVLCGETELRVTITDRECWMQMNFQQQRRRREPLRFIYPERMRFFSVLFAGGVAASLCLSSFSQTADQGSQAQPQQAPAAAAPAAPSSTPQLKLENLPPDPHTPTAEEEAQQAAERQRAQITRVAMSMANWGPKASSPGVTLTLKETGRDKGAAGTLITYRLTATGFAPGTRLNLLRWPLNQAVGPVMGGIVIDASGTAVCGEPAAGASAPAADPDAPKTAADTQTGQGKAAAPAIAPCTKTMKANAPVEITTAVAKGEAIRVALVAEDRKSGAAASVVPFPLVGEDKGCKLQILLGSK